MKKGKNAGILIILILLGAIIGGFVGQFLSQYKYFGWIGFGGQNGYRELFSYSLSPLIDTYVLNIGFNITVRVNAGSIVGMLLAGFLYMRK